MVRAMRWLARKVDSFAAAILAAAAGLFLSQAQAFSHQYLQRLGGHRDEAERTWRLLDAGAQRNGGDAGRQQVAAEAQSRFENLSAAYDALREAPGLLQPLTLARNLDTDIALRVVADFQPALPVDPASLTYAAVGMVLALILYDLIKWPFAALLGPPKGGIGGTRPPTARR